MFAKKCKILNLKKVCFGAVLVVLSLAHSLDKELKLMYFSPEAPRISHQSQASRAQMSTIVQMCVLGLDFRSYAQICCCSQVHLYEAVLKACGSCTDVMDRWGFNLVHQILLHLAYPLIIAPLHNSVTACLPHTGNGRCNSFTCTGSETQHTEWAAISSPDHCC